MRAWGYALLLGLGLAVGVLAGLVGNAWHDHNQHPFKLAKPRPTTIHRLGLVKRPPMHDCTALGRCFDYVNVWCQSPCATYRVVARVVSVKHLSDRAFGQYLVVLREGDATIAGRTFRKPGAKPGARVRVSGVLFFPTPRTRDGVHLPNGAEFSPILTLVTT